MFRGVITIIPSSTHVGSAVANGNRRRTQRRNETNIMNNKTLLLAVAAASLAAPLAQAREAEVRHRRAFEVEVETERGHYYRVQRSTNLLHWEDVTEPIYGDDKKASRLYRMNDDAARGTTHEYYRVVTTVVTNADLAPWSFAGISLSLNDDGVREFLNFGTETNGAKVEDVETDLFTYTFNRTAESEVKVDLNLGHVDRHTLYTFNFANASSGTFVREEFRGGRLKDRDLGAFQVLAGITNLSANGTNLPPSATNAVPPQPPVSLAGLVYLFHTGETPDRVTFLTASNGFELEDNVGGHDDTGMDAFGYTYELTGSNAATLVVTFDSTKRDEYALTFTEGAQGKFIRREFRDGVLKDTDMGAFSPAGMIENPGSTNLPSGGTNNPPVVVTPPVDLVGQSFLITTGETPDRLNFTSATAGNEVGDNATPNAFTYVYTVTGASTATVRVQFKADRWDEYDWTFTSDGSGVLVRREFDRSALKDTDSGTFTRATTP